MTVYCSILTQLIFSSVAHGNFLLISGRYGLKNNLFLLPVPRASSEHTLFHGKCSGPGSMSQKETLVLISTGFRRQKPWVRLKVHIMQRGWAKKMALTKYLLCLRHCSRHMMSLRHPGLVSQSLSFISGLGAFIICYPLIKITRGKKSYGINYSCVK